MLTKKSLGQHFLRSKAALAKIVEAARLSPDDTVLEVGPGEGALTELLLQKAFNEAKFLSLEQNILNEATADEIIGKIEREALALKEAAGIEIPEKKEPHPNLGRVTHEEAAELVEKLKKEGTLREEKHDTDKTKIIF